MKYYREYWYIGSITAKSLITKYITLPLFAIERYSYLALSIYSLVILANSIRSLTVYEVTFDASKVLINA